MILLLTLILQGYTQQCPENTMMSSYQFITADVDPKQGKLWNYKTLSGMNFVIPVDVNTNCQTTSVDLKKYPALDVQLFPLDIVLDIPDNITVTKNITAGPYVQYQTNGIKFTTKGLNNYVSYSSIFFTLQLAEHQFDYQVQKPDGELQIYFVQDLLYDVCAIEPLYAVLAFPVYQFQSGVKNLTYQIKFPGDGTTNEFNFKTNILASIKSDTSSYFTYKAPINLPPCGPANWYVSRTPLFISSDINLLLNQNPYGTMRRVAINDSAINLIKGKLLYKGDSEFWVYDDTVEWAATWVASIVPCVFFALIVCIYGQYELSNIGRYRRPEAKENMPQEMEALRQEELQEQKLA